MRLIDLKKSEPLSYLPEDNKNIDLSVFNSIMCNDTVLSDMQLEKVAEALRDKVRIVGVETGLGKSYIATGFLQALYHTTRNKNFLIMCVPIGKLLDFQNYLQEQTSYRPVITTGQKKDVKDSIYAINNGLANALICTPSAWRESIDFCCFIYNNIERVQSLVYDEGKGKNDSGFINFIQTTGLVPYKLILNATPLDRGHLLVFRLLTSINAYKGTEHQFKMRYLDVIEKYNPVTRETTYQDKLKVKLLMKDFGKYFIIYNREDIGAYTIVDNYNFHVLEFEDKKYRKQLELVELLAKMSYDYILNGCFNKGLTKDLQCALYSPETSSKTSILKTDETMAFDKLIEIVKSKPKEDNILIYVANTKSSEAIRNALQAIGREVFMYTGKYTRTAKLKSTVEAAYNQSTGGIAISNTEEGANLGSTKHIIIYGMPTNLAQFIPRAIRTQSTVHINLDVIHYYKLEQVGLAKQIELCDNIESGLRRNYPWLDLLKSDYELYYGSL